TMSPAALIPKALVPLVAPGTSIVVKTPRLNRKPWPPLALPKAPTMSPRALIPKGSVIVALGTSIVVKTPRLNRRPWPPLASPKGATMSPRALIPCASVNVAPGPGTSIVVKVNAEARSEDAVMLSAIEVSTSATQRMEHIRRGIMCFSFSIALVPTSISIDDVLNDATARSGSHSPLASPRDDRGGRAEKPEKPATLYVFQVGMSTRMILSTDYTARATRRK